MIRTSTIHDLDEIYEIEELCFNEAERASRETLLKRLEIYPNHFYVYEDQRIIGVINGLCTDDKDLSDDMYDNPYKHKEDGEHQMIFGLMVHPDYQHQHIGTKLMHHLIKESQNRKSIVLTCKAHLIPFYESLGFINEGLSLSTHGHTKWYQMRYHIGGNNNG